MLLRKIDKEKKLTKVLSNTYNIILIIHKKIE